MSTMCHFCSMELAKTDSERCCQMYCEVICAKCMKKKASVIDDGSNPVLLCKYCLQDYWNGPFEQDGCSSYSTPLTSPAMSMTSYESCLSRLGDLLDDLDFEREDEEETSEISQVDPFQGFSRHLEDQVDGNSLEGIDIQNYNDGDKLDCFFLTLPTEENNRFSSKMVEDLEDNKGEKLNLCSDTSGVGSATGKPISFSKGEIKPYPPLKIDSDTRIWAPPEPENQEEDAVGSVADDDDYEECYDGRKWGQSCSSSSPDDELGGSYSFKEQWQKAMMEVMNGRFRVLVRKLLTLERIPFSEAAGDSESWLDVVTSVSWKAAMLIKPGITDKGSATDPGSFVKVKCIASGKRKESQVIRGLVFSKKPGHKHMQTTYKNPRLLLFHGGLGGPEDGLSSLNSIEQEKKHLKSTIELVEMCCPNVVLVEKAVSRDVQESLQAKGITLVFDMKLPRLERIARCTGSHIVSSAEGLLNAKLKQCDTFRIEKVVEEYHFSYNEGARRLAKTLMFFEGCPIPLCCTILLKGARCDELKKVKFVVQYAVSLAYYLILETSFLVDQRAIFLSTYTDGNGNGNDILSCDIASNTNISSLKGSSSFLGISSKQSNASVDNQFQMPPKDDGKTLFDPQCILVLLTSGHIKRGTACKQNQLSRIMFYGSSDMSLGQFLHGILLNQKHQCSTCGEPPEAHNFSYIHKKGKLSVVVKRLSPELLLSGEAKGKLWMWRLCLKCERENGLPKPTRRVTMSSLAHCLSFGKFLDLSISNSTASSRLASCGHLLHRDCLQFYGLGSMVAMVGFSTVDIYTACMPSPILEFNNPNGREWLQNEAKEVLWKGNLLFEEVTSSLQKIVSTFSCSVANQLANELNETRKMLRQEKSDFEKAISKNGNWGQTAHHILNLNRLNHELLLELYVWDRRLQLLQLPSLVSNANYSAVDKEKLYMRRDDIDGQTIHERSMAEHGNTIAEDHSHILTGKDAASLFPGDHPAQNLSNGEPSMNITVAETSMLNPQVSQSLLKDTVVESRPAGSGICDSTGAKMSRSVRSSIDQDSTDTGGRELNYSSQAQDPSTRSDDLATFLPSNGTACQKEHTPTSDHIAAEISNKAITGSDLKNEETVNRSAAGERFILSPFKELRPGIPLSQRLLQYNLEDYGSWVWAPFPETCKAYRMDLQNGCLRKFDFVNSYNPSYLYSVGQLVAPESSRLHFPINGDEKIVSVYEDEFSSIIACALALLQERYCSVENKSKDKGKVQRDSDKSNENPNESLTSLDQEELLHSGCYFDPDQLPALSLEGFFSVDSLLLSKALHPEISLGIGNLPGHSKYSVICMYAKQFYALRKRCCPSELDYISSLSRSKKWDAKGGKSGVLFAKTLDDRFIVKQVKKTELNSFLMYAPEYFKHIFHSLSSGSQTCLAKILGIYQVIIRQSKSGKEVRTNLMVMENIFFGRNITKLYDLKGVIHSRYAPDTGGTLLDQNFVEDMSSSPLFVGGKTKQRMQRAIWNDTSFLTSINVMDYSLLLGVDKQSREIVFGIIDYLRQYTWDKQLETWVKSSLVVPKNEMPTVISPKDYKKRFRKFMYTYFFAIPDNECFHRFQGLHRTAGKDGDSQSYNAKVVDEPNFVSNSSQSNFNTIITPSLCSDLIFIV